MTQRKSRARLKKRRRTHIIIRIAVMTVLIAAIVVVVVLVATHTNKEVPQQQEEVIYNPGPPSPAVASTATVASTGDILLHTSVIEGADYGNYYDFTESFSTVAPYWQSYDYMIANLEVTLGGEESGEYSGYPAFNSPDAIVTGLKDAGVDCLLTANNHAYDTGEYGFFRTQQVIENAGLDHIGTRQSADDSFILIKDINGIRFGIACYSYDTRSYTDGAISLNKNVLSDATAGLVNSFSYDNLDLLYASIDSDMAAMREQECDVTIFFMHWGDEYTEEPNAYETQIAGYLCEVGVNIIVGGHPHVIQRYQTLTSSWGSITYCLYSMGNAISAQRKEAMDPEEPRGYTEDGLTFSVSYYKLNNGKVKLKEIFILPTWVDERDDGVFAIIPLDDNVKVGAWKTDYNDDAAASYNRTLGRVGEEYLWLRSYLGNREVLTHVEY